jgi:hypothetical protein
LEGAEYGLSAKSALPQMSESLQVQGIGTAQELPAAAQNFTSYGLAISKAAAQLPADSAAARALGALLAFAGSEAGQAVIRKRGMEPLPAA